MANFTQNSFADFSIDSFRDIRKHSVTHDVTIKRVSNLVNVTYTAKDPEEVAKIINCTMEFAKHKILMHYTDVIERATPFAFKEYHKDFLNNIVSIKLRSERHLNIMGGVKQSDFSELSVEECVTKTCNELDSELNNLISKRELNPFNVFKPVEPIPATPPFSILGPFDREPIPKSPFSFTPTTTGGLSFGPFGSAISPTKPPSVFSFTGTPTMYPK